MIASAVIVLPDPLSPARPSDLAVALENGDVVDDLHVAAAPSVSRR